jgi:glycosyltransferase involved in cell wall biosynthesis
MNSPGGARRGDPAAKDASPLRTRRGSLMQARQRAVTKRLPTMAVRRLRGSVRNEAGRPKTARFIAASEVPVLFGRETRKPLKSRPVGKRGTDTKAAERGIDVNTKDGITGTSRRREETPTSARESARGHGAEVDVSVVIPFRDAAAYLGQQLDALSRQRYERAWEVILVDNGSSDRSRQIAERFRDRLNLRIVDARGKPSPAYASNVGARAARGRKLLFVDADDEVAPGYLTAMATALERHEFVASRLDHETLNRPWVRAAHGESWQVEGLDIFFDFLPFASGCALGVSRRVFQSVGGFPEDYERAQDIAFSWNVQLSGTPLHFVPDAVLRYRYRDDVRGLYRQTRVQGRDLPLLYKRFRTVGMRRRIAFKAWLDLVHGLLRARSRADLAPLAVQLGFRVGRLEGSMRHRVLFL